MDTSDSTNSVVRGEMYDPRGSMRKMRIYTGVEAIRPGRGTKNRLEVFEKNNSAMDLDTIGADRWAQGSVEIPEYLRKSYGEVEEGKDE